MQVFEFHFNPNLKEDLIFDSFCYEPENIYEKRLGSLFLVGELRNVLPQNLKFLENLANFLKRQYYSAPIKFTQETSFKESLKKVNEFLEGVAKKGDVSWLGNLSLAILSLAPNQKSGGGELNFSKVGAVKILLIRGGQVIDIGKNLEFSEIEPYPLRIFGNIVLGKLAENDILLVLTNEIFDFFSSKNLLNEIAKIIPFDPHTKRGHTSFFGTEGADLRYGVGVEEKKLREVLKTAEKDLLKNSGVCLLCILTKEVWPKEKRPRVFTFQEEVEKFSIRRVFLPLIGGLKNTASIFSRRLRWLKEIPKTPRHFLNRFVKIIQRIHPQKWWGVKKNLLLFSFLIFFLLLGFSIFKREEEAKLQKYRSTLTTIQENLSQAESLLFLKGEEKAFTILKKSWQELLPLTEKKSAIQKEAISLKDSLEEKLEKISKLEKIPEPELFFEFDQKDSDSPATLPQEGAPFLPQKMVSFEGNLYFYSSFASNVYKLTKEAKKSVLPTDQKFNEAAPINNSLLFFKKPDLLFFLKNDQFEESFSLKSPYADFSPRALAAFRQSLYFLDGKNGEIVKYPGPIEEGKESPQLWLKPESKKASEAKSLAIDGSIWVLSENNTISRYFGGNLKEVLAPDLFPFPKDLSKMSIHFELLYLLEPAENRLIILNKAGQVLKQFQSEKFDNLKDFAVSEDGKTIWLLNGSKVYKIQI